MPPPKSRHDLTPDAPSAVLREDGIESGFIGRLHGLKDEYLDGNGHALPLLRFLQLFILSNRDQTFYFANNNARHFAFNADTAMRGSAIHPREATLRSLIEAKDNRFLPVYEFADEDNKKITHLDDFTDRFLKKCDLGRTISRYMVLIVSEQKPPSSSQPTEPPRSAKR